MKKYIILLALVGVSFTLVGCNKEEKLRIEQSVTDFKPMKKYSEGRAEEYVVDEKNAEEIAAEVFKEQIGILNNNETSFGIAGNTDEENVFVYSAVSDGANLPTRAGFSPEDITNINANGGLDVWAEDNETDFKQLIQDRSVASEKLEGTSEKKLTDSIQDAITYREKIQKK